MRIFEPEHRILTLEEALKEGKEIIFPSKEYEYSEDLAKDKVRYRQIINQMYKKGMVVGMIK